MTYLTQFLSTFRVVYWLKHLTWDTYIVVFYASVFLVFVVLIDLVYLALSAKLKKPLYNQPISLFRTAMKLLVPILIIPLSGKQFLVSSI